MSKLRYISLVIAVISFILFITATVAGLNAIAVRELSLAVANGLIFIYWKDMTNCTRIK